MNSIKKIQMYPFIEDLHTIHRTLVTEPPKGYIFIGNKTSLLYEIRKRISHSKFMRLLYHKFINLYKTTAILEATQKSNISDEADIIFSGGLIDNSKKPWVLYMFDHPVCLAGNNYQIFIKNKKKLANSLMSPNCKRIICTNKSPIIFMKKHFNKKINDKITIVDLAVENRPDKKFENKENLNIIFMGSINNPQDFYIKGGLYVIELCKKMSARKDISFLIRCKIPENIKNEISDLPNVKILEEKLPFEEIIKIYQNSDILLLPGHNYSVSSMLEGMSFGLPIIALDTYAVEDFIKDGVTGMIVKKSSKIKEYNHPGYPTFIRSDNFMRIARTNRDNEVIKRLENAILYLLDNKDKLRELSLNAQKECREKHSIEVRNSGLKRIFDDILKN